MATRYDAIVIGTGQSGPSLAARMAGQGWRTAVIERGRFGGTCVNVGCTPTKTMVASARAIHMARRGAEFGFTVSGPVQADMKRIKARRDAVVQQSNEGIEKSLKQTQNITVYEGHGTFTGPHTVRVNDETLEAGKIFVNVGARAFVPDMPGVADVPFLTNSSIMELDEVPQHLLIIGGSYIGLEFAQIFRRFGARVTVVEKGDRLIGREDADVSAALFEILGGEGVDVRLNATCIRLEKTARGVAVGVDCESGAPVVEGSHVLLAVGRRPNTDDLGAAQAGLRLNARGIIEVDDQCRTNVPDIWAIGECNGKGAFTHTSYNDYEVVASNLFDGDPRRISDRITCHALYTDPPVGRAGMSEAEVRATGRKVLVGFRPMTQVTRAREMSETNGFMKAFVDAETKRILGATVFGHGGDEIIHSILDVMYTGAPYTTISRAMHIHPTITELVPTMLQGLKPLD
jgi:pyruvate/2-oxoglutarate dehydrogenase complex dihydrolipoamide dehydrogenase (E3) component